MIKANTVNNGIEVELEGSGKSVRNELTAILFKAGKENPVLLMQSVEMVLEILAEHKIKTMIKDDRGFTGLRKGTKDA